MMLKKLKELDFFQFKQFFMSVHMKLFSTFNQFWFIIAFVRISIEDAAMMMSGPEDQYTIKKKRERERRHENHHVPTISIESLKNSRFNSIVGFFFILVSHFGGKSKGNLTEKGRTERTSASSLNNA
jgi:hypothetical protein